MTEPGLKVQVLCESCRGEHQRRLGVAPAGVPGSSGEGKTQLGAGEPPRKGGVVRRGKGSKRAWGAGAPSFGAAAALAAAAAKRAGGVYLLSSIHASCVGIS